MRLATLFLLAAVGGGCSVASEPRQAGIPPAPHSATIPGCYRMEMGPWMGTLQHKGFVPFTEFRLDTTTSTSVIAQFHAREAGLEPVRTALPEIGGRRPGPGVWYRLGRDSLFVEWNEGNIKGGYRLAMRGDSVVGVATTWTHWRPVPDGMRREDVVEPTALARGLRVPCDD